MVSLVSCGLDEHVHLQQIPEALVIIEPGGSGVSVTRLDFLAASGHARHYTIFYRIYISGHEVSGTIQPADSVLTSINPTLLSDFRAIFPFADPINTDINTTGIGNLFATRGYFELHISLTGDVYDARHIGTLLNIDFPDGISINFPPIGDAPFLEADGVQYTLIRSNDGGLFSPQPGNRLFLNHEDLNDNTNAMPESPERNRDTIQDTRIQPGDLRFTYVSMYILTIGFCTTTFSSIYSKPTHLGIFMLPLP